ncbi:uncharacterized protein LOC131625205 [Vicia villosa]|uniref:uncharacterized protein LOC131625205 n=1 Tax=Vicia villosa TaxID=3911 RepID=UPI00273C87B7|nr:uncharacterized protein LOC131625205 [Vicia villosa]
MSKFKVIFYTRGKFVKDPELKYDGGDMYAFSGQDSDYWSFFEACDLVKSIDPEFDFEMVKMWWKHEAGSFEADLNPFRDDGDSAELAAYAVGHGAEVDIYCEPKPDEGELTFMESVRQKGKGKACASEKEPLHECSGDSSDESIKDVHFDDSEEERMNGFEDDFEELVGVGKTSEVRSPPVTNNVVPNETDNNIFITDEMGKAHVIEEEYMTDELDSGADDDSGDDRPCVIRFNAEESFTKDFVFKVGMELRSLKQFKDAILEHNVLNGREVKFVKNDANRCRVVCKDKEKCDYTVLCSRVLTSTTFRIKTLYSKHKCGRQFFNRCAKADWVAKVIVDGLKNNTKMKLNDVVADVRLRYATEIPGCRAFKARQIARQIVEGDSSQQFNLLWSYGAELRRASPGNTFKLNTTCAGEGLNPRFEKCYMCFDGTKMALKKACRPFIGLDGCHLKHKYGGILLIAVGRDPNDQYLPIAFAVVENESKDTWSWFMKLLLEDIGDGRWCFISDQQKGLVNVFDEEYPSFEHRFCLRHLYANFKKKFGGGTLFRDLMMAAAKATYYEAHEAKMLMIKEANVDAYEWLQAIPKHKWCKHAFPFYSKCDVLMNNLSESFNATILLQRDKPIITMFEWIRNYLMGRFATLREKVNAYKGYVMTKPLRRLDREIEKSASWTATYAGWLTFQVTHVLFTDSFVVDLEKHTCSCNYWELIGIPCRHAVAAIHRKVDDPVKYVHKCYLRTTYEHYYSEVITPLNGQNKWPKTAHPIIMPPLFKRGPGRPKKLRRREPDEANQTKWQRTNTSHRCKICFVLGHNKRTCKKNKQIVAVSAARTSQEAPTQEAPTQEAPTQEAPKQEAPTQEAPTQASQTSKKRGRPTGSINKKKKDKVAPKTKKSKTVEPECDAAANAVPDAVPEKDDVQADIPMQDDVPVPNSVPEKADVQADIPVQDADPVQDDVQDAVPVQDDVQDAPNTDINDSQSSLKKYCGIDAETLAKILDDDEILDVQPLNVDTSPVKRTVKTFVGKAPKVVKKTSKSTASSSSRPTCSEPVKKPIQKHKPKKIVDMGVQKRQSDRLRTIKTKNIPGPGKKPDDPLVIYEDEATSDQSMGGKQSEDWEAICKRMTQ